MKQGFSLIEILIVIGIVGGLLAATFTAYNRFQKKRKETTTQTRLGTVEAAIESYHDQVNSYPDDLRNLVEGPPNKKSSYIPAVKEDELQDGWGQELQYEPKKSGYPPYTLYSLGEPGTNRPIYSRGSQEA